MQTRIRMSVAGTLKDQPWLCRLYIFLIIILGYLLPSDVYSEESDSIS